VPSTSALPLVENRPEDPGKLWSRAAIDMRERT
jgi:hypothetical protein